MQEYSELLKSLQHPMRQQILVLLGEVPHEYSYTSLLQETGLNSTGKLNYHLKILEDLIIKTNNGYTLSEYGKEILKWLQQLEMTNPLSLDRPSIAFDNIVPSDGLRKKYIAIHLLIFCLLGVLNSLFFLLNILSFLISIGIIGIIVLFSLWFSLKWINTVKYTITETELRIAHGVITKRLKIIPFRTITNLEVISDPFDRRYGIYSVLVETAGSSSQSIMPEGAFRGVVDGDEIRETILERIRLLNPLNFAIDSSHQTISKPNKKLQEILHEFKSINSELHK